MASIPSPSGSQIEVLKQCVNDKPQVMEVLKQKEFKIGQPMLFDDFTYSLGDNNSLPSLSDINAQYLIHMKKKEDEERQRKAKLEFVKMLRESKELHSICLTEDMLSTVSFSESKELTPSTCKSKAVTMFKDDKRFKDVDLEVDREDLFMNYLAYLLKQDKKEIAAMWKMNVAPVEVKTEPAIYELKQTKNVEEKEKRKEKERKEEMDIEKGNDISVKGEVTENVDSMETNRYEDDKKREKGSKKSIKREYSPDSDSGSRQKRSM